jgi:adenosylcobinamide-phosphate synthase
MLLTIKILSGFALDFMLGDPYSFPHPVRFIGSAIEKLETVIRKIHSGRASGFALLVIISSSVYFTTWSLAGISWAIEVFLIYTIFAARSLSVEGMKIYRLLAADDIEGARRQVSYLVSRDTAGMGRKEIIRAAVETVTENIVDGVTAPMFYLFAGGAPLAMAYKSVNTLDSMVGYKNEKYIRFGWASARFDDVLNFIPARITGFVLIPLAALITGGSISGSYRVLVRDRYNHSSPNSGHPESAAAGALGIRLGGPTSYFGILHEKPYIGDSERELEPEDIKRCVKLMYTTSLLGLLLGCIIVVSLAMIFKHDGLF